MSIKQAKANKLPKFPASKMMQKVLEQMPTAEAVLVVKKEQLCKHLFEVCVLEGEDASASTYFWTSKETLRTLERGRGWLTSTKVTASGSDWLHYRFTEVGFQARLEMLEAQKPK